MKEGIFTISLDLELYWGVHDVLASSEYKENLNNAQKASYKLLDVLNDQGIGATWAIVDALRFKSKQEFKAFTKDYNLAYENKKFSPFPFEKKMAKEDDSIIFAPQLIESIRKSERQEIATHTFSHSYVLEDGFSLKDFKKEIDRTKNLSSENLSSIIFPRNQYDSKYLKLCYERGFKTFRGNPKHSAFRPKKSAKDFLWHRASRWLNSFTGNKSKFLHEVQLNNNELLNIPASLFLRPYTNFHLLERLKMNRLKQLMIAAAEQKKLFHIWWHPHNFGKNLELNMAQLNEILDLFKLLKKEYGFQNLNMSEIHQKLVELE